MNEHVTIYTPTAGYSGSRLRLAPRLDSLAGKTVGFINNRWRCMDIACDEMRTLLKERYEVSSFIEKQTASATPLKETELLDLAKRVDAVITGMGN